MSGAGAVAEAGGAPASSRLAHRRDIEGLRAVAALLVAVYHIWLGRVSGGVDVFFVIAGFLITGTLVRQLHRTGRIDPVRYLGRLAIRLLPQALTVLIAVGVASVLVFPVTRRADVFGEILASALYVENWQLIRSSVDYLDRDRGDSPVQHFWAMSIQGQFYLIWLVLALAAVMLGARLGARRRFAALIGLTTAVSFVVSLVLTHVDQPVAYFHPAARAWEFGVGGLIALLLLSPRRRGEAGAGGHWSLGWIGLALILATGLVLPVSSVFPGAAALLPVVGAALILLAGQRHGRGVARVLGARPLVSLGGVAYAIYLWHWPVLVFTLYLRGVDRAGLWDGLGVLVASIALAYVSTAVVERPLRGLDWSRRAVWTPVMTGIGASLAVATAAAVAGHAAVPRLMASESVHLAHWAEPGSAPDFAIPPSQDPFPGVAVAAQDRSAAYEEGCTQGLRGAEVIRCTYGDVDAPRRMVLTGGSHALHLQPALEEVALQAGWRLELITKGGCRSGMSLVGPEYAFYGDEVIDSSCREWDAAVLALLVADPPDLVVGNATVVEEGEQDDVPAYYQEFWRALDEIGIESLGLRATPRGLVDRVECLAEHGADSALCDVARSETLALRNPAERLEQELPSFTTVDLTDWLCTDDVCPAVIEDTIVYHDRHHLTATFSRSLAGPLFRAAPRIFE